jgi:hypothetical protein
VAGFGDWGGDGDGGCSVKNVDGIVSGFGSSRISMIVVALTAVRV